MFLKEICLTFNVSKRESKSSEYGQTEETCCRFKFGQTDVSKISSF